MGDTREDLESTAVSSYGPSTVELLQAQSPVLSSGEATHNSDEELERTLATRPKRRLTPEERVVRRRLQYKLHQRRHRTKQKERTLELETEVNQLAETIAQLEYSRRALLKSQSLFLSRSVVDGAPAKIAMEYVRRFEFGIHVRRDDEHERFLRATLPPTVSGPDYYGVDHVVEQWKLYSSIFARTKYVPSSVDVSTHGDLTAVTIDVVLVIWPRRQGLLSLCPHVQGDEEAIQELVVNPLHIPGKVRFLFNEDAACSWLGTDMDFVSGLQRSLGCLKKVAACMEGANISFCTGQIAPLSQKSQRAIESAMYV